MKSFIRQFFQAPLQFLAVNPRNYIANYREFLTNFIVHETFFVLFIIILIFVTLYSLMYLIIGLVGHFKKVDPSPSLERGREPFVTVQIPTYNELAALNCAKRVLEFDYPREKLQIIIGDDSNKPEVSQKIDEFAAQHTDIVQVTRRGSNAGFKPGNLNHMLPYTKGDFVAVFDSDFLPPKDYLRKLMYPLVHDESITLTQARWRLRNLGQNVFSVMGGTISMFSHYAALPFMKAIGGNSYVGGSGYVIRKSAIYEIGGWREGTLTEDVESSLDLMVLGKKLVFLEDVLVDCEAPYTLKDVCRQQMRWAYGNVLAFKRNFKNLWNSPKSNFGDKVGAIVFSTAYLYPILLMLLSLFSLLQFIFPNPASLPTTIGAVVANLLIGVLLTGGSLFTSAFILFNTKNWRLIPKFIVGTLVFGVFVMIYVNVGTFKGLFGGKMDWFILEKKGNEDAARKAIANR